MQPWSNKGWTRDAVASEKSSWSKSFAIVLLDYHRLIVTQAPVSISIQTSRVECSYFIRRFRELVFFHGNHCYTERQRLDSERARRCVSSSRIGLFRLFGKKKSTLNFNAVFSHTKNTEKAHFWKQKVYKLFSLDFTRLCVELKISPFIPLTTKSRSLI